MVNKITLEQLLDSNYPSSRRREIKEVKIRPRSFDEIIETRGFLDLRDFLNLELLILENVPQICGWDLTNNRQLREIVFSNSNFFKNWDQIRGPQNDKGEAFPGGKYYFDFTNYWDDCLSLRLNFPNNPELVKENVKIVGGELERVIFNLPTRKEKELERQVNERISPEELAEILQTQTDLQIQLEEKERENRLLKEQLEEILQRNEEQLLAMIEVNYQLR